MLKLYAKVALIAGMPGIRIQCILGPVWGKKAEQLRKDVVLGTNPISGEAVLSSKNWAANVWGKEMNYPKIIRDIYSTQDGSLFGTCAVLSPAHCQFCKRC